MGFTWMWRSAGRWDVKSVRRFKSNIPRHGVWGILNESGVLKLGLNSPLDRMMKKVCGKPQIDTYLHLKLIRI